MKDAPNDDEKPTPEEQAANERVLALTNKLGDALDGSLSEEAVEACAVTMAKICADSGETPEAGAALLLRGLALVHWWFDEFQRAKEEEAPGAEPPKVS